MAIRWDQVWKQLGDWGGDYDIFDDYSHEGGARDQVGQAGITGGGAQGQTKPGYDETGRYVGTKTDEPTPTPTENGQVQGANTGGGGGGGLVIDPRTGQLRQRANSYLDELLGLYNTVIKKIRDAGADATGRVNKSFDEKILDQINDLNNGLYSVDVASAASNLADSSFRSADRDRVQKASDANVKTLNSSRGEALSTIGSQVEGDVAKYMADRGGVDTTRSLLGGMDADELQESVNTLDATKRGLQADQAKYGPQGSFIKSANALATYDTAPLEQTLQAVIRNTTASGATKSATVNDIIDGTGLTDEEKSRLKNKYTQVV